jgi:hypothetical protein
MSNNQPVKPSTADIMDRVNGDLKAGDLIVIRSWVGARQYSRLVEKGPMNVVAEPCDADVDGAVRNRALFGDVLEVMAVEWPNLIVTVHTLVGGRYRALGLQLDARHFECSPASANYLNSMKLFAGDDKECSCAACVMVREAKASQERLMGGVAPLPSREEYKAAKAQIDADCKRNIRARWIVFAVGSAVIVTITALRWFGV